MSRLEQKLVAYAAYHRDRRNVLTHMLGIPLIVFAVAVLLSRPVFGGAVTPAMAAALFAALYYLTLDVPLGGALALYLALCAWAGLALGALPTALWLGIGAGAFLAGWGLQFLGHGFEGRKPAFFDDLVSLLIGPLFIAAECAFWLGRRGPLKSALQRR